MDIEKLAQDVDAIAVEHGITERHHIDTLAGVAVRAIAQKQRYEAARIHRQIAAAAAIDQMIESINKYGSPLAAMQAGL